MLQSKAELLANLKNNQKFQDKLAFTKNEFYPAVVAASKNVDDAKMFLSSLSGMMLEKFLDGMKKVTFAELKLEDLLDPKDEKYEEYKTMFELLNDKTVFDAKDIIEGMRTEIQLFIDDEMKERQLWSLKAKWIDEL